MSKDAVMWMTEMNAFVSSDDVCGSVDFGEFSTSCKLFSEQYASVNIWYDD